MAQNTKRLYNLQAAFTSNPGVDTLYVTSDGLPFKLETDANRHAEQLVKKATPAVMPKADPQLAAANAAILAAGVVTPVTRATVGVIPAEPAKKAAANAVPAAAAPGPAVAPVTLTLPQAQEANTKAQTALTNAQTALDTANKNLTDAQEAKAGLPTTATPKQKGDATKSVNIAQAAVNDANMVYENAQVDALLAAQNLVAATPTT